MTSSTTHINSKQPRGNKSNKSESPNRKQLNWNSSKGVWIRKKDWIFKLERKFNQLMRRKTHIKIVRSILRWTSLSKSWKNSRMKKIIWLRISEKKIQSSKKKEQNMSFEKSLNMISWLNSSGKMLNSRAPWISSKPNSNMLTPKPQASQPIMTTSSF